MKRSNFGKLISLLFIGSMTVSCSTATNEKIDATATDAVNWVGQQFSDAGDWISKQYSDLLNDDEQEGLTASTKLAAITGKDQVWKSEDGEVTANIKVIKTEKEKGSVSLEVPEGRLAKIPALELIDAPYRAIKNANVRSGAGTDFNIVDKANYDSVVVVIGKVQDKSWYLVGDGDVATGFVFDKLLEPLPESENTKHTVVKPDNNYAAVQEEKVETEWLCRTLQQTIRLADGETKVEEVRACQGQDGWEIK
ncbi:MAG: SH3 domain-containing protein [Proteobacteria bacterium]|nr:SH3 domain-containing protein [Pseudomonadota bacterium]